MHPRSIFKLNPPNYDELARKYSNLRPKCYIGAGGKICVDFRDPEAVRLVSTVLLQEYFELEVTIPQGVLVPRIPQRLNYILLIEDLLNKNNLLDEDGKVLGIDIGTGTTCIYPLLGASLNRWRFVGTDISPKSIEQARANVQANSLGEVINLVLSGQKSLFMEVFNDESFADQEFTFSMCNPPFFDQEEVDEKFSNTGAKESNEFRMNLPNARRGPPKSGTTAMDNEISFKGGEFAFVQQMIEESKQFPHRTKIYTSMVGKRISLQKLKDFLGKERIRHSEYSLNQGRTARWVLAWTFFDGIDLEIHSE